MHSSLSRGPRVLVATALLLAAAPGSRLQTQDPRLAALDSIRTMGLDSVPGVATAYF